MSNFFQSINPISNAGLRVNDDRGNPLNLPINQQSPHGIYRTSMSSNNPGTVMVNVSNNNTNSPLGFTPQEAYYIQGSQSINTQTGYPVEAGYYPTSASLVKNSSINKIFRTKLSYKPLNASPIPGSDGNIIPHGNSLNINPNISTPSQGNDKYPKTSGGFINPFDTVIYPSNINPQTGVPMEFGDNPQDVVPNWNNPNSNYNDGIIFNKSKVVYQDFNNLSQYNFLHNLDKGNISQSSIANPSQFSDTYLASFIQTSIDNEDPVMFGYDIVIKYNSSPLFNGSITSFIDQFGPNDPEIESRRNIWVAFCNQFFKFFSLNQPSQLPYGNTSSSTDTLPFEPIPDYNLNASVSSSSSSNKSKSKAYYLKKISGLDKLVEGDVSHISNEIKSMVEYGKDIITLSLYEDVSVNTGYLATLYKMLSWSRLRGKQIIPENLLRFDAVITITEIRDYNRVIKDNNNFGEYADKLSKYNYTLYDCQFLFNKLSHGNEIDMSGVKLTDDFDISFNYKYSTLNFTKFKFSGTQSTKYSINNSLTNLLYITPSDANYSTVTNGSITNIVRPTSLIKYNTYNKNNVVTPDYNDGIYNDIITQLSSNNAINTVNSYSQGWDNHNNIPSQALVDANLSSGNTNTLSTLGKKLTNAVQKELSRQVTTRVRLLNTTLDNIRNAIGLGRMSEPTNVYYGNSPFRNDLVNAARDFVGQSVKGFFSPNND